MMTYQVFRETLRQELEKKADGVKVEVLDILGNNKITYQGIGIMGKEDEECFSSNIYDCYDAFKEGLSMDEIVREILQAYIGQAENKKGISNRPYEEIKEQLVFRLLNLSTNKELLTDMPYIEWNEFAIVFCVVQLQEESEGMYSIPVTTENMEKWDVTEEKLFQAAVLSTPKLLSAHISYMRDIVRYEQRRRPEDKGIEDMLNKFEYSGLSDILILSNEMYKCGAAAILYPELLKNIADLIGYEFYIVPVTVNEVILVNSEKTTPEKLRDWHRAASYKIRGTEDWLSDEIYLYDKEKDEIIWIPEANPRS